MSTSTGNHSSTRSPLALLKNPAFIVVMVILLGSGFGLTATVSRLKLYLQKLPIEAPVQVRSIPTETERWRQVGQDAIAEAAVLEKLGTSNYLTRVYVEKNPKDGARPRVLELHLAYYTGMVDTVPHVPERCMVGGGWSISGGPYVEPIKLDLDAMRVQEDLSASPLNAPGQTASTAGSTNAASASGGREPVLTAPRGSFSASPGSRVRLASGVKDAALRITKFSMPGSDQTMLAGYFFLANGGITDSAEGVRLLAFDLRSRYAYYLKVQISSQSLKTPAELAEMSRDFLQEVLPDIMTCVPDWTLVERGEYPPTDQAGKAGGGSGRVETR